MVNSSKSPKREPNNAPGHETKNMSIKSNNNKNKNITKINNNEKD